MTSRGLLRKPVWKDPLLWVWLVSLPISFQVTYWWEENVGTGVDSGRAWASEIGAVWLAVTLILLLVAFARRPTRSDSA